MEISQVSCACCRKCGRAVCVMHARARNRQVMDYAGVREGEVLDYIMDTLINLYASLR